MPAGRPTTIIAAIIATFMVQAACAQFMGPMEYYSEADRIKAENRTYNPKDTIAWRSTCSGNCEEQRKVDDSRRRSYRINPSARHFRGPK